MGKRLISKNGKIIAERVDWAQSALKKMDLIDRKVKEVNYTAYNLRNLDSYISDIISAIKMIRKTNVEVSLNYNYERINSHRRHVSLTLRGSTYLEVTFGTPITSYPEVGSPRTSLVCMISFYRLGDKYAILSESKTFEQGEYEEAVRYIICCIPLCMNAYAINRINKRRSIF